MIETRFLKILLKSFHENYSDLLKKQHGKFLVKITTLGVIFTKFKVRQLHCPLYGEGAGFQ